MSSRLDLELVRRSLARSRSEARNLIRVGAVLVGGTPEVRTAAAVNEHSDIAIDPDAPRWVSRGGVKLWAALERFEVDAEGRHCIDVGASTGGFTEVLLARGAGSVVALDVGHGQLAPHLAADPRVVPIEGLNVREVASADLGGRFDLLVADLSFISLRTVAPSLAGLTCEPGDAIVLVKPQFEVGRASLGSGGVVRDPDARVAAVMEVLSSLDAAGLGAQDIMRSPLEGGDGNVEYLVWAVKGAAAKHLEAPG